MRRSFHAFITLAIAIMLGATLAATAPTASGDPGGTGSVGGASSAPARGGAPAAARPAKASMQVSPTDPMPREQLVIRASVPTDRKRPVVLQRRVGKHWAVVKRGKSSRKGAVVFRTPMAWSTAELRVQAPKVAATKSKKGKKAKKKARLKPVTTVSRRVVRTSAAADLVLPTFFDEGDPVAMTLTSTPARAGRSVTLQRATGESDTWTTVSKDRTNAAGTATFELAPTDGIQVYRAVLGAFHGAAPTTSPRATTASGVRQSIAATVTGGAGSAAPVDLAPTLTSVTKVQQVTADPGAPSVRLTDSGLLVVDVPAEEAASEHTYEVRGVGCSGATCQVGFVLDLDLNVIDLAEQASQVPYGVEEFTAPSIDRRAAARTEFGDTQSLVDEIVVVLGTDVDPGYLDEARFLASEVDAFVSGGIESIGVYEFRWASPPDDLDAVITELRSRPGVASVERSTFGGLGAQVVPGDWDDDGQAVRWPFEQMNVPEAWDLVPGRGNVKVGIVDVNQVWSDHEDLDVVSTFGEFDKDRNSAEHGTHVAGLACALENDKGVVGSAGGCPITTSDYGDGEFQKEVLLAGLDVALDGAKVVNMSLGYNDSRRCQTQAQSDQYTQFAAANSTSLRRMFNGSVGRNVVWTFSAGNNCGSGPQSPMGAAWSLPNVITVAASNSDGTLASYSNFGPGIEVAAGGGVGVGIAGGGDGPISTWFEGGCGFLWQSLCSEYKGDTGTSMASPLVAGVAALARSAAPNATAADVGSCIVATAGTDTPTVTRRSSLPSLGHFPQATPQIPFTGSIGVVDALATIECVKDGTASADVLIAGQGDRTASGNGTDRGDLFAAITGDGYQVVSAATLPEDLSGYDQIWYLDTEALTGAEQDRVAAFVEGGGGLYLTGEWGCCSVDSSSIALINRLVAGANVSHAGTSGDEIELTDNFGLASTPNAVASIRAATPGMLAGVARRNVIGGIEGGTTVGAWDEDDVTGDGRIAIVMDINWVAVQYRGDTWDAFVENLAHFLER